MKQERTYGVAVTSAKPYADHLQTDNHFSTTSLTQFFTGWMLFLMANQLSKCWRQ